jgi:hypothetical protein
MQVLTHAPTLLLRENHASMRELHAGREANRGRASISPASIWHYAMKGRAWECGAGALACEFEHRPRCSTGGELRPFMCRSEFMRIPTTPCWRPALRCMIGFV